MLRRRWRTPVRPLLSLLCRLRSTGDVTIACWSACSCSHAALQVHVIDDDSVLTSVLDSVSSTKVRRRFAEDKSTLEMVGTDVLRYVEDHDIDLKVAGSSKWAKADKKPVEGSRS